MRSSIEIEGTGCGVSILRQVAVVEGRVQGGFIRSNRFRWDLLAVLVVLALASWFLLRRWHESGFDPRRLQATLAQIDLRWLAAAVSLSLASYYGRVLRWAVMLEPLRPNPSLFGLFSATAIGFTAVVLFGRPGEFVRPFLIARREKVTVASQLAAWFLERLYDFLLVFAILGFALVRVVARGEHLGPRLQWVLEIGGWFIGICGSLCILLLLVLHRHTNSLERYLLRALGFLQAHHQESIAKLIRTALDAFRSASSTGAIVRILLYSVLEWALIVGCYAALFQAFPETRAHGLADVMVFLGFVSFGSIVQIPGVGGGLQLVAALVLTEFFHLSLEAATGIALLLWIISFIVIVPIGLLLAFREGLGWRSLLQIEKEASL